MGFMEHSHFNIWYYYQSVFFYFVDLLSLCSPKHRCIEDQSIVPIGMARSTDTNRVTTIEKCLIDYIELKMGCLLPWCKYKILQTLRHNLNLIICFWHNLYNDSWIFFIFSALRRQMLWWSRMHTMLYAGPIQKISGPDLGCECNGNWWSMYCQIVADFPSYAKLLIIYKKLFDDKSMF